MVYTLHQCLEGVEHAFIAKNQPIIIQGDIRTDTLSFNIISMRIFHLKIIL